MVKRIVVVEDQDDLRLLIRLTLKNLGNVSMLVDIGNAFSQLRSAPPDLVVLDVWLGIGNSGLDICRQLKSDPATSSIKVLMLSACGQQSDIAAGTAAGADRYVIKPFSPQALVQVASELLGS